MTSVFIADDHKLFVDGVRNLLESSGEFVIVGEADETQEAIRRILELKPDIALLDLGMPGQGGLEATRAIHSQAPSVRVVVVSGQPEELVAVRCLKAGASGFVHKRSASRDLLRAIEQVAAGGKFISSTTAATMLEALAGDVPLAPLERLSNREIEVMQLVASGHSSSKIASDLNLSIKTISTYRSRIGEKLGLRSTAEIVRYALSNGLID